MALTRGATGLSAVCDCGISRSFSLLFTVGQSTHLGVSSNLRVTAYAALA